MTRTGPGALSRPVRVRRPGPPRSGPPPSPAARG
jgi:hypothetical protein